MSTTTGYTLTATTSATFGEAVERVRTELKDEGFGPDLGTLLPCNVVVYERNGGACISAIDAERMLSIVGNEDLTEIAARVREKLSAVVERAAA